MNSFKTFLQPLIVCIVVLLGCAPCLSGDWPMWRYNAARANAAPDELPAELHLQWVRQLPAPRPAWPASQGKLQFDATYQPIVSGHLIVVGSMVDDSVTAYASDTGREAWRFFTDGPVRFAPIAWRGRVYAASDDGYLYCLDSVTGRLLWKVRGGPDDRRVIGNDRLISTWPIRGGPVLADGTIYLTAGIWPFMGIFIRALDADSGHTRWLNSETGSLWVVHPHHAPAFGSVVPQGYLAVSGDKLIVPGGRSLPAVFDRHTGRLEHFQFGGKGAGGWAVAAHKQFYVVGGAVLDLQTGLPLANASADVLTDSLLIGGMTAYELEGAVRQLSSRDRRGRPVKQLRLLPSNARLVGPRTYRALAMAGRHVYAAANGKVARFDVEAARKSGGPAAADWSAEVSGQVTAIVAGDSKLLVVTDEPKLYCFGAGRRVAVHFPAESVGQEAPVGPADKLAEAIVRQATDDGGYALCLGAGSPALIDSVLARSQMHLVVLDPDAGRIEQLRRRLWAAGLYGTRVAAHAASIAGDQLPPYFATLVFAQQLPAEASSDLPRFVERLFAVLRPYGGVACIGTSAVEHQRLAAAVQHAQLASARLSRVGELSVLRRQGPLPDSADWTHQYGDAANTLVSKDRRVRAPLGLLWFGGPPNDEVLPRHGHGPSPQVAGGRLVIEGPDMLRAVDVYTGRLLWQRRLPGIGQYYNVTEHFAGAGEIGSNYVTLPDAVYVAYGDGIVELDPATGQTRRTLRLGPKGPQGWPVCGFLAVDGPYLVATATPVQVATQASERQAASAGGPAETLRPVRYASSSRRLVVIDRQSGRPLWARPARLTFRHNAIVLGDGKLFCIDGLSAAKRKLLARRGLEPKVPSQLLALDLKTGQEIWSTDQDVFGTFLHYSAEHDVLLQAGSAYRDRAADEAQRGMVAYRGRDGHVLWKNLDLQYNGPCMLWHDRIITNGSGGFQLELLTGRPIPWRYTRMYGCNTAIGSEHLLTFRSGAAGFCDLTGDSGTGNLGGFRSSCTANLIVADGVLNAPDYTRACVCAYQNQCSLALVPMPDAEMWTFSSRRVAPKQFAVNLGAPGDRRGPDGTMWYELPVVGGSSPELPVKVTGSPLRTVRHHASLINGGVAGQLPWVAASCVTGIERIEQRVPAGQNRFRVRLYFAELENLQPGQRVFDVVVNGKIAVKGLDIAAASGGPMRALVKEIRGVEARSSVLVTFRPVQGEPCLSGIQILAEEEGATP